MSEVFDMQSLDLEKLSWISKYISSVDDKQKDIIKILHYSQEVYGYLPKELQLFIARKVDLPASKINGIVTFYSFFNEKKMGKYAVSVCMGTACYVKASKEVIDEFEKLLKVDEDGLSEDGLFSLNSVRCIGACGLGPVVKVNDRIFGHVNKQMVQGIIDSYKNDEEA